MARSRQRRRTRVWVLLALAGTLLVVAFAADVSRAAHGARSVRRTENRSFGQLANDLTASENAFDGHLAYLLVHGQTLTRVVFTARLTQLGQSLATWTVDANLLRRPAIAHQLNTVVAQLTEQRVDDDATLLDAIAARLHLPWAALTTTPTSVPAAQASLGATARAWARARFGLVREPGRVRLAPLDTLVADLALEPTLAALATSPTLVLHRSAGITAVAVSPAPLPAPAGELLLEPAPAVTVAATVTNAADVVQPVALTLTLASASGAVLRVVHQSATLGPLRSVGFALGALSLAPSAHATLVLTLSGVPPGGRWPTTRRYRVIVAPAGSGG